ncbi:MAG TPA: L-threonylcarbamoyladenylate synthase [Candidatus Limnocylindrales bacterium]|nr:L-threonylcarbamoyladenylate synthase [Candidatus Limnocylindrales bacterium]
MSAAHPPARVVRDGHDGRAAAVRVLRDGGIVALPTDTVYGIGCALDTRGGIEALFAAKKRPPDRAIMLLLADAQQAWQLGVETAAARVLAERFWPGGMTLVLERRAAVTLPAVMTAGAPTVGLRVPAHDCPRALARHVGPFPVTSANRSGEPELQDAQAILSSLGGSVDLVVDGGPAAGGPASSVVDCSRPRPRLIRAGAIDPGSLAVTLDAAGIAHDIAAGD